jgi:hypothetical protein
MDRDVDSDGDLHGVASAVGHVAVAVAVKDCVKVDVGVGDRRVGWLQEVERKLASDGRVW